MAKYQEKYWQRLARGHLTPPGGHADPQLPTTDLPPKESLLDPEDLLPDIESTEPIWPHDLEVLEDLVTLPYRLMKKWGFKPGQTLGRFSGTTVQGLAELKDPDTDGHRVVALLYPLVPNEEVIKNQPTSKDHLGFGYVRTEDEDKMQKRIEKYKKMTKIVKIGRNEIKCVPMVKGPKIEQTFEMNVEHEKPEDKIKEKKEEEKREEKGVGRKIDTNKKSEPKKANEKKNSKTDTSIIPASKPNGKVHSKTSPAIKCVKKSEPKPDGKSYFNTYWQYSENNKIPSNLFDSHCHKDRLEKRLGAREGTLTMAELLDTYGDIPSTHLLGAISNYIDPRDWCGKPSLSLQAALQDPLVRVTIGVHPR